MSLGSDAGVLLQEMANKFRQGEREIEEMQAIVADKKRELNSMMIKLDDQKKVNQALVERREGLAMIADAGFAKITELDRSIHASESTENARYLDLVNAERSLAMGEQELKKTTLQFIQDLTSLTQERMEERSIFRKRIKCPIVSVEKEKEEA